MSIFRRRQTSADDYTVPEPPSDARTSPLTLPSSVGRLLFTSLEVNAAIGIFERIVAEEDMYSAASDEVRWLDDNDPAAAIKTVAVRGQPYDRVLFVVFARQPMTELWIVPSHFDISAPIPMPGQWKMRDGSVTSRGSVLRPGLGPIEGF